MVQYYSSRLKLTISVQHSYQAWGTTRVVTHDGFVSTGTTFQTLAFMIKQNQRKYCPVQCKNCNRLRFYHVKKIAEYSHICRKETRDSFSIHLKYKRLRETNKNILKEPDWVRMVVTGQRAQFLPGAKSLQLRLAMALLLLLKLRSKLR